MNNNSSDSILNFLLGTAIGVGLGMLFAPKKGEELRADLKQEYKKSVNYVSDSKDDLLKTLEDKKAELEVQIQDAKVKALNVAEEKLHDASKKAKTASKNVK